MGCASLVRCGTDEILVMTKEDFLRCSDTDMQPNSEHTHAERQQRPRYADFFPAPRLSMRHTVGLGISAICSYWMEHVHFFHAVECAVDEMAALPRLTRSVADFFALLRYDGHGAPRMVHHRRSAEPSRTARPRETAHSSSREDYEIEL